MPAPQFVCVPAKMVVVWDERERATSDDILANQAVSFQRMSDETTWIPYRTIHAGVLHPRSISFCDDVTVDGLGQQVGCQDASNEVFS